MKTSELIEAKVVPDWVKQEHAAYSALVKRYGLLLRDRPKVVQAVWTFGGKLHDADAREMSVSLEKRVGGLQKAVAQHLFNLVQAGREVVTYDVTWYGHSFFGHKTVDRRPFFNDDSLAYIEQRVKDKLFINTISGGGYSIFFQYGVSDPKPVEAPKPVEKKVYRVVKGSK